MCVIEIPWKHTKVRFNNDYLLFYLQIFGHHYKMKSIIPDTELKSIFFPADQINRSLEVSLELTSARKNGARDGVAPITSRDTFKRLPTG